MDQSQVIADALTEACLPYVPRWCGVAVSDAQGLEATCTGMVCERLDQALRMMLEHIAQVCAAMGRPFNPAEWRVERLFIVGGN